MKCIKWSTLVKIAVASNHNSKNAKGQNSSKPPKFLKNKYFVDEFFRFSSTNACTDMSPKTVIKYLTNLFSLFGMYSYIHTDCWPSFQSTELKSWLLSHGVATSHMTNYNPQENGQCERFNGTIWKTILSALKNTNLPVFWDEVLSDDLHVSTCCFAATNCTPHERMFNYDS